MVDSPAADPPEAVFSVLGDETRLRILLELADRSEPEQAASPVPFSELRRAAGVEDAGRFSYHLDKLREGFVTKEEDGYSPTVAGLQVASSIHAGRYAADVPAAAAETEYDCHVCGEPLEARYEDGVAQLGCDADHTWFSYPVPAGATAGRTVEELLDVALHRATVNVELARNGICPRCWGITTTELQSEAEAYDQLGLDVPAAVVECDRCWLAYSVPATLAVARSPPVVAFYQDHGLSIEDAIASEHDVVATGDATVDGRDPLQATVEFSLEGDRLAVELDEHCEIRDHRRRE